MGGSKRGAGALGVGWFALGVRGSEVRSVLGRRARHGWREADKLLQSVPGVGKVLSTTLLGGLPELGKVSRSAIAALVGVAPYNSDSGKHRGERHIRGGRHDIRRALYCATRAAVSLRYNSTLVAYYERLRASGKSDKVALVACMRKLLLILNAMIRTRTPWASFS